MQHDYNKVGASMHPLSQVRSGCIKLYKVVLSDVEGDSVVQRSCMHGTSARCAAIESLPRFHRNCVSLLHNVKSGDTLNHKPRIYTRRTNSLNFPISGMQGDAVMGQGAFLCLGSDSAGGVHSWMYREDVEYFVWSPVLC